MTTTLVGPTPPTAIIIPVTYLRRQREVAPERLNAPDGAQRRRQHQRARGEEKSTPTRLPLLQRTGGGGWGDEAEAVEGFGGGREGGRHQGEGDEEEQGAPLSKPAHVLLIDGLDTPIRLCVRGVLENDGDLRQGEG